MNKCFKCGYEFDGAFCPQCGTKYEKEKTCPNCQSVVDGAVKFCNHCGYSFERTETTAVETKQTKSKYSSKVDTVSNRFSFWKVLAKILPQVSLCAFALFSLLLWAFFSAPLATIFGESFGNVYSTINGTFDDFLPIAQASIAFAIISLFYVVVAIVLSCIPNTSSVTIGKFSLVKILSVCSNIFYIPFFALGCATINKVKEMGMEKGSYSDVVIAFSAIFAVISIGSLIADFLLYSRISDYANAVNANLQTKAERNEEHRKLKAERRANAAQILTENNITEPANVERPNIKLYKAIAKAYKYNVLAWAVGILAKIVPMLILVFCGISYYSNDVTEQIVYTVIQFVDIVLWMLILWFLGSRSKTYVNNQSKLAVVIVLTILLLLNVIINAFYRYVYNYNDTPTIARIILFVTSPSLLGLIMTLIYIFSVSNNIADERYLQGATIRKYKKFSIVNLILSIISLLNALYSILLSGGDIVVSSLLEIIFGLIPIVLFAVNISRCNRISKIFGINGSKQADLQVVTMENGEKALLTLDVFCSQLHNYDLYCDNKCYYDASVNRVVNNRGLIDKNTYSKRLKVFKTIIVLILAVAFLTAGIIGSVADAKNIFKISKVAQINYIVSYYNPNRTSKSEVEYILGKADVETDYVWTYYSSNYIKKLNKIKELNEQMSNAQSIEQAIKIQEQIDEVKKEMQKMEYKYIIVTFDDKDKAVDVKYDFHYNSNKSEK